MGELKFPQYRKYKNGLSYFEIKSDLHFLEYKLNGDQIELYDIQAKILPDRNYVQDMLYDYQDYWEAIDAQSLEAFLKLHRFS